MGRATVAREYGLCPKCQLHYLEKYYRNSVVKYRPTCNACRKRNYRMYKKSSCEFCGFIPVHPIQLDVDHIDGNHDNNDISNLQTLCANCHRLKTLQQRNRGKE